MYKLTSSQKCGEQFSFDTTEFRKGGVTQVIERIRESTGAEVSVTTHSSSSANQEWTFGKSGWGSKVKRYFSSGPNNTLPQYDTSTRLSTPVAAAVPASSTTPPAQDALHLLSCVHQTDERKSLLQEPIDTINNDRSLFQFMGQQLQQNRGRLRSLLSLRSVQGVFFLKVMLRKLHIVIY